MTLVKLLNEKYSNLFESSVSDDLHNTLFDHGYMHKESKDHQHKYVHKSGETITVSTKGGESAVHYNPKTGKTNAYSSLQVRKKLDAKGHMN